jgi:hypothetical protein
MLPVLQCVAEAAHQAEEVHRPAVGAPRTAAARRVFLSTYTALVQTKSQREYQPARACSLCAH